VCCSAIPERSEGRLTPLCSPEVQAAIGLSNTIAASAAAGLQRARRRPVEAAHQFCSLPPVTFPALLRFDQLGLMYPECAMQASIVVRTI
jgi:hypothetical protein